MTTFDEATVRAIVDELVEQHGDRNTKNSFTFFEPSGPVDLCGHVLSRMGVTHYLLDEFVSKDYPDSGTYNHCTFYEVEFLDRLKAKAGIEFTPGALRYMETIQVLCDFGYDWRTAAGMAAKQRLREQELGR